jgi:hypothetical protein
MKAVIEKDYLSQDKIDSLESDVLSRVYKDCVCENESTYNIHSSGCVGCHCGPGDGFDE